MNKNKIIRALIILQIFAFTFGEGFTQNNTNSNNKKIVVIGSSVASGWVSSYKEKYDMQNGYVTRLARFLQPKGWEIINKSVPGFNTKDAITIFEEEVIQLNPDYLLLGLSMSNEGLETKDPDSVSLSYETGINKIIDLCKEHKITPVIGLCYSNDNYTGKQYDYLKRMNLKMNALGVACVNLLGVLDDGNGHFPEGHTFDPNHPNDRGHEELFYAFVPDMFDAIKNGKNIPKMPVNENSIKLGAKAKFKNVGYVPTDVIHSFSFGFSFKTKSMGTLAAINVDNILHKISLNNDGYLLYKSDNKSTASKHRIEKNKWHNLFITHSYLSNKTILYIDGIKQAVIAEQIEPIQFLVGNNSKNVLYRNMMIYRGALNKDEISALENGKMIHAGLEIYSLLDDTDIIKNKKLNNIAVSLANAVVEPDENNKQIANILDRIEKARVARNNEIKVKHKKAIKLNSEIYNLYVGKYEIAPGDYFLIEKEDDKLYFVDRGNKAELLPETKTKFFIKYPAELTVLFEIDENEKVKGLIFSMNGREMKAKRIK
ncbi:GDSL-type esterase/lipase family protein [Bacteroidota bacterium]